MRPIADRLLQRGSGPFGAMNGHSGHEREMFSRYNSGHGNIACHPNASDGSGQSGSLTARSFLNETPMGIEAPMGISASNCKDPLLRLVICYWTWLVLVSCCASQSAHAEQGKELHIQVLDRAAGGLAFVAGAKKIEVDAETAAQLAAIRFTVECAVDKDCSDQKVEAIEGGRKVLDNTALKRVLSEAGEKILAPFTEEIRRATRLRIQVPANLVKVAIDALQFDGQPLYVRKPIVYTIGRDLTPSKITLSKSSVGLLVSDRSTDPQRAVFAVADLFKSSQRLDAEGLDRAKLQKHPQIDFAVISAHGRAGYSEDDFIQLPNQEVLSPDLIARLRPQLVYFELMQYRHQPALPTGPPEYRREVCAGPDPEQ